MTDWGKWFWPIRCDNTVENPYVADAADLMGHEEDELNSGKSVAGWDPRACVRASKSEDDGDPDDVLQTLLDPPIYSMRLRRALEKAGITGIQYLPIHVVRPDGTEIEGFCVANILNLVPALDLEMSEYVVYPDDYFLPERVGQVRSIHKTVLRRSALAGLSIVRLVEFDVDYYVSERFKAVFEEGGFTGYSFSEVKLS